VRQLGDAVGTITTQYLYDGLGRPAQASNPYRPSDTPQYTATHFDALDRPVELVYPDNAVAANGYDGNLVTSRDPADKWKQTTSDALGRLTSVTEDPTASITSISPPFNHTSASSPVTKYTYTHQGDLVAVCQNCLGTPVNRSFTYDSLRRLRSASNPESGLIQYDYYNNGDLKTRLDARNITTTYLYDTLNRITSKSYSANGSTGPSAYCYDGDTAQPGCSDAPSDTSSSHALNLTGRLTRARAKDVNNVVVSSSTDSAYDSVGRVLQSAQATGAQSPYPFQYAYNLAGGLETLTYPSMRAVNTCYDALNRAQSVAKTTGGTPYAAATAGPDPDNTSATLPAFTAHGDPQRVVLGNGIVEAVQYNNRLQPVSISAALAGASNTYTKRLRLGYGYGTSNNGNVMSETIDTGGLVLPRSYGYDALNRLQVVTETGAANWQETSRYDAVGNRWVDAGTSATYGITLDQNTPTASTWYNANNQLIGGNPDEAGNLRLVSPFILSYDAENRIANVTETVNGSTFTVATYQYDADGRRVSKVAPSGQTVYVYDAGGDVMAEYGLVTDSGTTYLTTDHLGSTRLLTDASGGVRKRYDYKPFGEELLAGMNGRAAPDYNAPNIAMPPDAMSRKFTGKERDAETGLDYFGARYMSSAPGRFTKPDPLKWLAWQYGTESDQRHFSNFIGDPQNLNLYAYVRNNPLRFTDPTGMYYCTGTKQQCAAFAEGLAQAREALKSNDLTIKQKAELRGVLKFLGADQKANGVVVKFGSVSRGAGGQTDTSRNFDGTILTTITLPTSFVGKSVEIRAEIDVHEGDHGVTNAARGRGPSTRAEHLTSERNAYRVQSYVPQGLGVFSNFGLWDPSWGENAERNRKAAIEKDARESTALDCKASAGCR
jgi:RHS repeat-associated protein